MKTYTVHHPTGYADEIAARPEKLVFVPEAFSWLALIIPFFWLLFQRLWIVAAIYFSIVVVLSAVAVSLNLSSWATLVLNAGLHLFMGLEGNGLRRWALQRRGYKMIDIVNGKTKADCEVAFFRRLAERENSPRQKRPADAPPLQKLGTASGDNGLFPVTGGDA
ncbi:MAG: DUF2628 domain-containing protein [Hyphomicrobiales bacterium]